MSVHRDKVASLLERALQEVLGRGLNDPRVRGLVSVTAVRVSPDLADATINVSVMPAEHARTTVHGLRHAAAHLRTQVGQMVRLRRMPRLHFVLDEGLKRQADVLSAIARAARDEPPAVEQSDVDAGEERPASGRPASGRTEPTP